MTCTGTYTITNANVIAGFVTNTATATGDSCNGDGCLVSVQAQATITLVPQPSWTLTKTPTPPTYTAAGQTINYSYLLTNTGNVTIASITLTDDKIATVSCPAAMLSAGASMTCTGSYVTTAADVTAGSVVNRAVAAGIPSQGALANAIARARIRLAAPPSGSITIIKAATGGNATFNFAARGTGVANFSLTTAGGTATRVFSGLTPGRYRFTEISLPRNWRLTGLTCAGDTGGKPTTVDLANRAVTVGLDGGEAIVCTFANGFDDTPHIVDTQNVIRRFLSHRVTLLANNEPDRARFVRRVTGSLWGDPNPRSFNAGNDGPFSFSGYSSELASQMTFATSMSQLVQAYADANEKKGTQDGKTAMAMATKAPPRRQAEQPGFDVWIEAHFSKYRAQAGSFGDEGNFGLFYLGADYLVTPSVLLGALVQFDWLSEASSTTINSSASGTGWMAGPYLSVRLTPHLFFDSRAAWGTSSNRVNPFGTYEDGFATQRWLANARLTGNWTMENFRITPSVGFTYIEEQQRSYTDSLGIVIPSQTVALGRLSFGPEFAYRYMGADGTIYEPMISITGQWDAVKPDVAFVAGMPVPTDNLFARVQGGVMARWPNGFALRAVASYDGIGSSSFNSVGGRLWVNVPFH